VPLSHDIISRLSLSLDIVPSLLSLRLFLNSEATPHFPTVASWFIGAFKLGLGRRKRAIATQMLLVTTTPASWNLLTAEREDADAGGVGVHTPTVRIRPPDPTRRQRPTIPPHPDAPRQLTLQRKWRAYRLQLLFIPFKISKLQPLVSS